MVGRVSCNCSPELIRSKHGIKHGDEANNNAACCSNAQTVNVPLCEEIQRSAREEANTEAADEANTEAADEASDKTAGA